jgi:predicted DNA binding CopG/RHH family protein
LVGVGKPGIFRLASKQSKPYQTLIHELLERATQNVA